MSTRSGEQLRQLVEGTFVGPIASGHDTPTIDVIPIDWNAYDLPRLFDTVRREADELAWLQARGFENLAQLLLSQHDKLQRLRDGLADSWDPQTNAAAVNVFRFLDDLIAAMAEDAIAHACTSRGLSGILTAVTTAKENLAQLKTQWDNVTTDWVPEWWDHEAADLNTRAREIVSTVDRMAGEHRRQITVPGLYQYPTFVSHMQPPTAETTLTAPTGPTATTGSPSALPQPTAPAQAAPPPPVPGCPPVPPLGPDLQALPGVPQLVPAIPGSPISVLPVPPGNSYAPTGGAYVLPGPGIGRGGWIYPMTPPPTGGGGPTSATAGAPGGPSPGPAGLTPTPTGITADTRRTHRPGRGHGELVWEVAQGVPPIIGGDLPAADEQTTQRVRQEEAFVEWFADLATPWADDLTVQIRRPPEPTP